MRALTLLIVVLVAITGSANASEKALASSISNYLKAQGPIIEKKVYSTASKNQMLIYFCVDTNLRGGITEGANNPANTFCEVTLFNKKAGRWISGDNKSLGQGAVKEFNNNRLITESVTYGDHDALCCPSVKTKNVFYIHDGRISDVKP